MYSTSYVIQACPFVLDVFTEDNEGEIEIVDLLPATPHVDPALSLLIKERGVCVAVFDGKGELNTYTFTTPHMTTIVVENKVTLLVYKSVIIFGMPQTQVVISYLGHTNLIA